MVFIGDVHGKIKEYQKLLGGILGPSIQVGDLGVGLPENEFSGTGYSRAVFIHGNHDNPAVCDGLFHDGYLGRYGYLPKDDLFFVSGGFTRDKTGRTLGVDLFFNEELDYREANDCLEAYTRRKPRIVVSHMAPSVVASMVIGTMADETQTGRLLQAMWKVHKPDHWVFGHYHKSWKGHLGKTKFVCLDELEVYWI